MVLAGNDLFDVNLVAGNQIGFFAFTMGANFCVFHSGISFSAIITNGYGFDFFNEKLRILKQRRLFYSPSPAFSEKLGDYAGDFAYLKGYGGDFCKRVFLT